MRYLRFDRFYIIFLLFLLHTARNLYAAEYIAFSLKVAQEMIAKAPSKQSSPDVFNLGGITAIRGLVYDHKVKDAILVGEKDPTRALLTLDDFVVALRARFIHAKWPLVSIDPTEETKKTEIQIVRFEGGIEDTQFGEDLFDADCRLKKVALGLLPPGISGFKTHWDLQMEMARRGRGGSHKISSRFWFYPVLTSVSVREDVIAIKGLKVGVFTEVLSAEIDGKKIENLSTFQDETGDRFAKAVSEDFERLAKAHPSFLRLQGLDELVALTKAIEDMDEGPDLSFWLRDYRIKQVETEKEVKVLRREEEYYLSREGGVDRWSQEFSGGVQLMAIALRLKAGDVTALKEAALKTRPKPDALIWGFIVGNWLIPTSADMLEVEYVPELLSHADFLQHNKRYDDALALYEKIIQIKPDCDEAYYNRGMIYNEKGEYERAIAEYNRVLEINPRLAEAYYNRGIIYGLIDEYDKAILDYNHALEIKPMLAEVYIIRGATHLAKARIGNKNEYNLALTDLNHALEINPRLADAYYKRGFFYYYIGMYSLSIADYTHALKINPRLADAYMGRGVAHLCKRQDEQAISDFEKAVAINPMLVEKFSVLKDLSNWKGHLDQVRQRIRRLSIPE